MNWVTTVTVLILLIILLSCLFRPEVYNFVGPGPKFLIVAGTHGDEPAPSYELESLLKKGFFEGWNAYVIPRLNRTGVSLNFRLNHIGMDVNRNYSSSQSLLRSLLLPQNACIQRLLPVSDIVIDFHEANHFHQLENWSLGNTLSVLPDKTSKQIADMALLRVNSIIPEEKKKFVSFDHSACRIPGSLSCLVEKRKKSYMLVELCRGSRIFKPLQSVKQRRAQTRQILESLR